MESGRKVVRWRVVGMLQDGQGEECFNVKGGEEGCKIKGDE